MKGHYFDTIANLAHDRRCLSDDLIDGCSAEREEEHVLPRFEVRRNDRLPSGPESGGRLPSPGTTKNQDESLCCLDNLPLKLGEVIENHSCRWPSWPPRAARTAALSN